MEVAEVAVAVRAVARAVAKAEAVRAETMVVRVA